jgi:hypothetical protein
MGKVDELLPPQRNFTLTLAERVRALEGLPAHLYRMGQIERMTLTALDELRALVHAGADEPRLRRHAASKLPLARLNDLIDKHNRYYPIEANLPIDPETGGARDFVPLEPVTVDWLLAHL